MITCLAIPIIDIAEELEKRNNFWVYWRLHVNDWDQSFYYMGCHACGHGVKAAAGRIYTCSHCKRTNAIAKPRLCFKVLITDSSGTLEATVYIIVAEKHFKIDATEIVELEDNGTRAELANMQSFNNHEYYMIHIRTGDQCADPMRHFSIDAIQEAALPTPLLLTDGTSPSLSIKGSSEQSAPNQVRTNTSDESEFCSMDTSASAPNTPAKVGTSDSDPNTPIKASISKNPSSMKPAELKFKNE